MRYSFILLGCCTISPALAGYQRFYPRTSDFGYDLQRRAGSPPRGSSPIRDTNSRPLKAKVKMTGPGISGGFEMANRNAGLQPQDHQAGHPVVRKFRDPMEAMAGGKSHEAPPSSQPHDHVIVASAKGPYTRGQVMAPEGGSGYVNVKTPTQERRFHVGGGEMKYFSGATSPSQDTKVHAGATAGGLVSAKAHNRVQPGQPDVIEQVHDEQMF